MKHLRLLTFTSLAVLSACAPPDSALRVNVTVRTVGSSRVRADCLRITVSNDTQELKSLTIKRPADDTAVFAVRRGSDLPGTVKVQASGYIGSNCGDDSTLKLNAQGESVTGVFPESGVTPLEVFLDPPNSTLDADHDGFVAASKGGLDCNDTDAAIFPGAGQVCANNLVDTDCDGQAGCDDSECGGAAVCADPPDRVQITTAIATMLRYECRGPFRVELRNPNGPRLAIRDTPVTLTSSLAGVTVHGTASCSDTAVTSLPIPYGQSFFEVYLKADGQAFGSTTLEATAAQVPTPGRAMVEVHPQPIDHLEFTSMPRTVSAGACSTEAVTLEFRDAQNRRTDVDAPTTITMSSMPGDLLNANIFFSDAACATDGSMQQLMAGQGTLSLHVKAKRAGTFTLTATPSAGTGQTQLLTVMAAAADRLAFTNGIMVLSTTQLCSAGLFTVQLQDSFNNPVTAAADVPIAVSVSGLSNVTLYDTSTMCVAAAQSTFTIAAGTNSVSFRARGMTATPNLGSIDAAVANGAAITPASQELRISAGSASKFTMAGNAQSPLASVCSANPFSISLLDSADNPASSPTPVAFTLTTVPAPDPSFHFYSGAGCQTDLGGVLTMPAGQTSAQFYYRGNKAVASFEIRASSTLTPPATFLPGNSIRANAPGKLVFAAPASQTAQAGTCTATPYVANVLDLFDNPTSFATAQTVTVASNPVGPQVGTSSCASGLTVPLAAGAGQVNFVAGHTVTSPVTPFTLTASVGGFSTLPGVTLNVTPGPSTLTVDVPASGTANLTAGGCLAVTLGRRDMYGNNAPTSGTINLGLPAGTFAYTGACPGGTSTAGSVTSLTLTNAASITFNVKVTTVGSPTITATLGAQVASFSINVSPGLPTLQFEAPASGATTITAGTCATVTIARRDPFGNDVVLGTSDVVTFSAFSAGTNTYAVGDCGGTVLSPVPFPGTAARVTFLVRATLATVQTIQMTVASQSVSLALTVSPAGSTFRVVNPAGGMANVIADQCVSALVDRRDPFNNLVPLGAASNLTFAPTGPITAYASTTCTGLPTVSIPMVMGASSQAFGVKSQVVGTPSFVLTLAGQTAPLGLTVSAAPTSKLSVEGLPASLTARGCTGAITVRRLDPFNNDVTSEPNLTVTMSSPRFSFSSQAGTCGSPTTGATVTIANGASTSAEMLFATANLAGAAVATANATAPGGPVTGNASTNITAGPASKLVLSNAAGTVVAGACSASLTVELKDQDDNPVTPSAASPVTLTLASTPGTPTFFPQAACAGTLPLVLTSVARVGTFTFRPTTAPSTETITVSAAGVTDATQMWNITTGSPTKMVWKQNPATPVARFACVSAGIIQIQDSSSNVTTNPGASIVVTPTPSTPATSGATFYSDAACTMPVSTVSIPNMASETPEFFMIATGASPVTLAATSVPALTAPPNRPVTLTGTGSLVVTPVDPALEAGACVAMTVTRNDGVGAFTKGTTSINLSVPTTVPQNVTLHLAADCSDVGQVSLNRVIANGASTTVVYARGRSVAQGATSVDVAFSAVDALGGTSASTSGATNLKAFPLVRRGACNIAAAGTTSTCALVPAFPTNDISRSFLVFSSTGSPNTTGPTAMASDEQSVECHLDASGTPSVVCSRINGPGGGNGAMSVNYQVVSWGRDFASGFGVSVQHIQVMTGATSTAVPIPTPVASMGSTFVLASSKFSGQNDGDAFPVVRLTSTSNVEVVTNTTAPHSISIQVVSFAGSTVTHASATAQTGNPTVTVTNTATPSATTFVLGTAQVNTDSTNANLMCKRQFKGKVSNNTDSTWRRGANASAGTCTGDVVALINVQRVSVPSAIVRVAPDTTITGGGTAGTATLPAGLTATHKAIVLTGMQGPGGQCAGEGATAGTGQADDDTGSFHATLDLTSTTNVAVTRTAPNANADSVFSVMGVQFDP